MASLERVARLLPECVVLLGVPIEPWTLLYALASDDAADTLEGILLGYQSDQSDARSIYAAYPRLVQILGERDEIANGQRSGWNAAGIEYQVPPIIVPDVGHYALLGDRRTKDAVCGIVECCATGGFPAVVAKYAKRPRFDWEEAERPR